jgi:hypothetical protein
MTTDKDLIADIAWLYVGHDTFQHDDVKKARTTQALHDDHTRAVRVLTAYVKTLLEPPYSIEDVADFIKYLDWDLGYSL